MERILFSEEHEIFRSNFRQFVETRVVPKQAKWREQGVVDREIWLEAGEAGFDGQRLAAELDDRFDDQFRVRRHQQIAGLATRQFDGRALQCAGNLGGRILQ